MSAVRGPYRLALPMKRRQLKRNVVETNGFAEYDVDIPTIRELGRDLSAVASRGNYVRADNNDHDASHEHDGN